jgi:Zn-dependent peptidase ImmA (M78 family)
MPTRAEHAARQLLAEWDAAALPIPVEDLARRQGATVHREPFAGDVSGMVVRDPDGGAHIAVNSFHAPVRQRFTIAHELGHLLLHEGKPVIVEKVMRVNLRGPTASLGTDSEEREANAFAAELLMPAKHIDRAVGTYLGQHPEPTDDELIRSLAGLFDVSEQAMRFRMINLRLLAPYGMA